MKRWLWENEILGNALMWSLTIIVVVFAYYLGGLVNISGFVITVLALVIFNMAGNSLESGQGIALLTLGFSGWFLIGFIPGLVISNWNL